MIEDAPSSFMSLRRCSDDTFCPRREFRGRRVGESSWGDSFAVLSSPSSPSAASFSPSTRRAFINRKGLTSQLLWLLRRIRGEE